MIRIPINTAELTPDAMLRQSQLVARLQEVSRDLQRQVHDMRNTIHILQVEKEILQERIEVLLDDRPAPWAEDYGLIGSSQGRRQARRAGGP